MVNADVQRAVIRRTLRVPLPAGPFGDSAVVARQLDAVLMSVGFKLTSDLYDGFAALAEGAAIDAAVGVLGVVRELVGDHVEHNVYFRDFPRNVPDTVDFWMECLTDALLDPVAAGELTWGGSQGWFNLLDFPRYGRYQHGYAEMLAAHDEFVAAAIDHVAVLSRGSTLDAEASALYLALAGSTTPLGDEDREILHLLAAACVDGAQPTVIPVRENRALVNQVRLASGAELLLDTVTDVLRVVCAYCGGDVSLVESTKFVGVPRRVRRALLAGLDRVVTDNPAKLSDVNKHREQFKRLGERLHPHEYPQWPGAARVFAVARGELSAPSLAARVEVLLAVGDVVAAANVLADAPGMLMRALDRLLRTCRSPVEQQAIVDVVATNVSRVSGRVLLSTREHFGNRVADSGRLRIFVNQKARGRVVADARATLAAGLIGDLITLLDNEIRRRLPITGALVVDPDVLTVALPITGKAAAGGFGVLPRGSVTPITGERLRFFTYWKEEESTTDYDLSTLMLDEWFAHPQWVAYTNLTERGVVHSGDIVTAPEGASEFIDIDLTTVEAPVLLAQVNVFSGEGFDEVAESFFGFMLRDPAQEGAPFEPGTVRMKSDLRGSGRVALPVAFLRDGAGQWRALWLHLRLAGWPAFNQVENNRVSATALLRAVVERQYLTVGYLVDLLGASVERTAGADPVTFIGFDDPGDLPAGSTVITPRNLGDLIPQ